MSDRHPFGKSWRDAQALRSAYIREHGQAPTPKQLRRFRRHLTELARLAASRARAAELPRTGVLGTGGEAA